MKITFVLTDLNLSKDFQKFPDSQFLGRWSRGSYYKTGIVLGFYKLNSFGLVEDMINFPQ